MLIALLVMLGVNLLVIVAFVASVLGRKRWVMRQPGAFPATIRVTHETVDGLGPKWRRGYGRWVRDVLVWEKGPFLFRTALVAVDSLTSLRPGRTGEVKRIGDHPVVAQFVSGLAIVEVAADEGQHALMSGPYRVADPSRDAP